MKADLIQDDVVIVYALIDPLSALIVYVGQTNTSLQSRLSRHLYNRKPKHLFPIPMADYVSDLWALGLRPEIHPLEITTTQDGKSREDYWIIRVFWSGGALLNGDVPDEIKSEFYRRNRKPFKRCRECQEIMPCNENHYRRAVTRDGLAYYCRQCEELSYTYPRSR